MDTNVEKSKEAGLSHDVVRELLHYDPNTGIFTRLKRYRKSHCTVGSQAGWINWKGYRVIDIAGISVRAHRLAFFYVTGRFPTNQLDHINGDVSDNRFCNLREATASENQRNRATQRNNKSGATGIYWYKSRSKWKAEIGLNGKNVFLGYFNNLDDAKAARRAAEIKYHGEFAQHVCRASNDNEIGYAPAKSSSLSPKCLWEASGE